MSGLPQDVADPRPRGRRRCLAGLVCLLLLASMLGCHSLGLFTHDQPAPRKDPDPTVAQEPRLPNKYSLRIAPCIFSCDRELKQDDPLFKDLTCLRDQVYSELKLTPSNAMVQVYLFEDQAHYERYMKAKEPTLPNRRAFFIANHRPFGGQDELLVYTYWGPKVQQDLRHELTHALLHSVLKQVPQWLDEGIAEYFELPAGSRGLNPSHVAHLQQDLARGAKPDLVRLEGLREVNDMQKEDYREAWAWVHLMLHGKPEARAMLFDYLRILRDNVEPPPLGPKLAAVYKKPEEALMRHINGLDLDQAAPVVQRSADRWARGSEQ